VGDELDGIAQAEPRTHIAAVLAYRVLADAQRASNLLAIEAFGHGLEDLDLARGEWTSVDLARPRMRSIELVAISRPSSIRYAHGMPPVFFNADAIWLRHGKVSGRLPGTVSDAEGISGEPACPVFSQLKPVHSSMEHFRMHANGKSAWKFQVRDRIHLALVAEKHDGPAFSETRISAYCSSCRSLASSDDDSGNLPNFLLFLAGNPFAMACPFITWLWI
jgi:hypothetical protein